MSAVHVASVDARTLVRPIAVVVLASFGFMALMRLAVRGHLPTVAVAILAPTMFIALVAAVFHALAVLGAVDRSRTLPRREGFWVVVVGTLVGLPFLGASGLVDPWETHYAEVAREMIERRDFISPWWANDGWFMSKPVLLFWLEAIAMVAFGVRTGPDQVLGAAMARPEWAVRFPVFAIALVGTYILHAGVSRACGRRAGFVGAVVLWTMPGFALLSHQAMTDMPLVGGVGASLGLIVGALARTDAELVPTYSVRFGSKSSHLHAGHALAFAVAIVTLSQIVLLLSQHVRLDGTGIHLVGDRLVSGSPHACTLPGQPACARAALAHPKLTPFLQAMLWLVPMGWLVLRTATERRTARLLALAAWGCAAFAAMAKGPAGLVVPAAAGLVHALATRSYRSLLRLEIPFGLLLAVVMIGPWYLAIYARHGRGFIDELVMRHMLGRTLDHLHDTNEGEDIGIVYFVRQLAYATFPWSGIALASVFASARPDDRARRGAARAISFGAAMVAFALVSSMRTKFHHYVLVALPPIAMLAGMQLDELIAIVRDRELRRGKNRATWMAVMMLGASTVAAVVGREIASAGPGARGPAHFILLLTYRYDRTWPSTAPFTTVFAVLAVLVVVATATLASVTVRKKAIVVLGAGAVAFSIVLLDVYLPRCAADGGQRGIIAAYYRDRPAGDRAPLVAYQLNWKGENFYTGNHVALFISSGAPMKAYLDRRRASGESTVYFVTERTRLRGLQSELGAVRSFSELTSAETSAQFALVRASL